MPVTLETIGALFLAAITVLGFIIGLVRWVLDRQQKTHAASLATLVQIHTDNKEQRERDISQREGDLREQRQGRAEMKEYYDKRLVIFEDRLKTVEIFNEGIRIISKKQDEALAEIKALFRDNGLNRQSEIIALSGQLTQIKTVLAEQDKAIDKIDRQTDNGT